MYRTPILAGKVFIVIGTSFVDLRQFRHSGFLVQIIGFHSIFNAVVPISVYEDLDTIGIIAQYIVSATADYNATVLIGQIPNDRGLGRKAANVIGTSYWAVRPVTGYAVEARLNKKLFEA